MCKQIVIFFCLLLPILYIYPKDKILNINGKETTIAIPDKITEENFIEIITSYLETKSNLEESEKDIETYKNDILSLQNQLTKTENILNITQKQMNDLYILLESRPKEKINIFRPNIKLGMAFDLDKNINANIGLGVTLFEWVDLGLLVTVPELNFGIILTIYISK